MTSGKLDEELLRMSAIADAMEPGALMLFNESFASTYEREGSEIARDIVHALLDRAVRVVYVTHMYDLAQGFTAEHRADITSLRAERQTDGTRTFRIVEQAPLPTSYGADLYDRVFGAADHPAAG
jgi:DNA mismatch repair ATPase MutS